MAVDHYDPGVCAEPNFGNADYHALSPAERRARGKRLNERAARWRAAESVRASWAVEQFEEEARQIAAQVAEWEESRDAA